MRNEIWKPIKGFEGFYEVSSSGRVRSIDRIVYFKNNKGCRHYKGKVLSQKYHNGYAMVNLNKNKNLSVLYVHRIVAETFIPNPNNFKVVNHVSGIKTDNSVENLEWCTSAHNNLHARKNNLTNDNMEGFQKNNDENKIQLSCYKNGNFVVTQDCSRSMARYLIDNNLVGSSNIETIARAIRSFSSAGKSYYGLTFVRHNEPLHDYIETGFINIIKDGNILTTQQYSKDCALWLLKNNLVTNVSETTLARSIRKAIRENKPYHKFIFQKIK